jgi:hypothetical protein
MIIGNSKLFAIECEIKNIDSYEMILGHFRFWIDSLPVGDWEDLAYLTGIVSWICAFALSDTNRYEALLEGKSKELVYQLLYESVMVRPEIEDTLPQLFDDIYSRFHISYIGMSSFDNLSMLLIESPSYQRVIWRVLEGEVQEMFLPPNEMQRVAKEFCLSFKEHLNTYK